MKRLAIVFTLILALLLASSAFGQSDLYIRNGIFTRSLDGRGGIPFWWDGFVYGAYVGTSRDCIYWNYTGTGHYILNLNGDGSPVFTVDKTGAVYAAGGISASIGLPDTDSSNYMVLTWNEDDSSDRVLNFVLGSGDRTLTLNENLAVGDGYDVTITAEDAATAIVLDNANFEVENGNATQRDMKFTVGTDANAALSVEGTSGAVNQDVTSDGSPTFTGLSLTNNITGEIKHLRFTLVDPNGVQAKDNEVCIWLVTDAAITISKITVALDAAGNDIAGDLKYADAFIGLANPVVINDFDTTSGVRVDTSISIGAVPSGKCIYISFDASPNAAITQVAFDIEYSY